MRLDSNPDLVKVSSYFLILTFSEKVSSDTSVAKHFYPVILTQIILKQLIVWQNIFDPVK